MKRIRYIVSFGILISIFVFNGCSSVKKAEDTGWKLVFSDNFKRDKLGKNWKVINGNWIVKDGYLRGNGTLICIKEFFKKDQDGCIRLEFEAASDVQPFLFFKNRPKFKVVLSDMSSFIHALPLEKNKNPINSGYFFQFGGYNNQKNQIRKVGLTAKADAKPDKLIVVDKRHKIVVENDNGLLRLIVDGKLALEHKDKSPLISAGQSRIGFYFYTAAKLYKVKVYIKQRTDLFAK